MEIRKVSVSTLFGMFIDGCKLVRRHLGKFMLASFASLSAIILLTMSLGALALTLLPKTDTLAVGNIDWKLLGTLYAAAILIFMALVPPFLAGWFSLCRHFANGQSVSIMALFAPYGNHDQWKKLIVYSLFSLFLYIVGHALYMLIASLFGVGGEELASFVRAQDGDLKALYSLSGAFWAAYVGLIILGVVLQSMFMLGFCQAALTESTAGNALKACIIGTLKNLISILLFLLMFMVAVLVTAILIGILAGLALGLLGVLSKTIAYAIGIALYVLIILLIYPLLFSFQYYLWKGILGGDDNDVRISDSEVSA